MNLAGGVGFGVETAGADGAEGSGVRGGGTDVARSMGVGVGSVRPWTGELFVGGLRLAAGSDLAAAADEPGKEDGEDD